MGVGPSQIGEITVEPWLPNGTSLEHLKLGQRTVFKIRIMSAYTAGSALPLRVVWIRPEGVKLVSGKVLHRDDAVAEMEEKTVTFAGLELHHGSWHDLEVVADVLDAPAPRSLTFHVRVENPRTGAVIRSDPVTFDAVK
jgi:hypothetical protein